jgi:hypothetical protein
MQQYNDIIADCRPDIVYMDINSLIRKLIQALFMQKQPATLCKQPAMPEDG